MEPVPGGRLGSLLKMLERDPADPFLLYGIAMEHKKAGESAKALDYLGLVVTHDPNYSYAYYQRGLIHESDGDVDAAKTAYREGVASANRKGDEHARGEIEAALQMLD